MLETPFEIQKITVVLPSYKPDEKLPETVQGLCDAGFTDLLVVDDGGGAEFAPVFAEIEKRPQVTVLHHAVNRGKGAALKTAFAWLSENRTGLLGAVTADGDGQHLPEDILACAKEMCRTDCTILGSRDFSGSNVPRRSRMGNRITSFVFLAFCGLHIHDTQTGLRAIPARFLPALTRISGERYEYETNMLLEANRIGMPMKEKQITTVYLDENSRSHFHPFRDSLQIYSLILKYLSSSLCASLTDLLVFYLLLRIFGPRFGVWRVFVCTVLARLASSLVNYLINRNVVFAAKRFSGNTLLRYFILAIPVMFTSIGLVTLLDLLFDANYAILTTLIKLAVDTLLFFVTFRIQRRWVFCKK